MIENDDKKPSDKLSSGLVYFTDSECTNKFACNFLTEDSGDVIARGNFGKKLLEKFYTSLYNYYTLIYNYILPSITCLHSQYYAHQSARSSAEPDNIFGEPSYNILMCT